MPLEGKDGWGSSAPEISGVFVDVGDVGVFSLDLSVNSEASDECNISDRRFEARKKTLRDKPWDHIWDDIWDHIHQSITLARPPLLTRSKVSGTEPWGAQIGKFFRFLSDFLDSGRSGNASPVRASAVELITGQCSLSCAQVKKRDAEADARAYLDAHRLHEVTELCISQLHADTGFVDIASYRLYSREMPQFQSGSFRIRKDTLNSMLTWGLQKQHYT